MPDGSRIIMTHDDNQALSQQLGLRESPATDSDKLLGDSRGIVKNIDILTSEVIDEDADEPNRAEEDCGSDSDSLEGGFDARKMFSNRSIREISLGNLQQFKLLNQHSQVRSRFQSVKVSGLTKQKPVFPS